MFEGLVDDVESSEWNMHLVHGCVANFLCITYSLWAITFSTYDRHAVSGWTYLFILLYMKIAFII